MTSNRVCDTSVATGYPYEEPCTVAGSPLRRPASTGAAGRPAPG
jgi:hypothetical protein